MKILHVGNLANYAFFITRYLREKEINAELLLNKNKSASLNCLQYFNSNDYPNWIKTYDTTKKMWYLNILKIMRQDFDILHAYAELPIYASFSGKKFIANVQGSDLRELAFSSSFKGRLLRRAYKKAKVIIIPGIEGLPLLEKLNISNGIFIPAFIDLNHFSKHDAKSINNEKLTIFQPTFHDWNTKKNNNLIIGFKKFLKYQPNSKLKIIKRGKDIQRSINLIKKLELENYVEYYNESLSTDKLIEAFESSDIIADQFLRGELGGIGREALCAKKPLLTSCFKDRYEELLSSAPPVSHAISAEEICEQLIFLSDKKNRIIQAQKGYDWIIKNYHPDKISNKFIRLYEEINNKTKIKKIREIIQYT